MTIHSDIEDNDEDLNPEPNHVDGEFIDNNNSNDGGDNDDDEELSSDSDYMDDEEYDDDDDDNNDSENNDNGTKQATQDEVKQSPKRIYVPNMSQLSSTDNVEQLECDYSAYVMYHKAETGFPCLSFDVLEDTLGTGEQRAQTFPLTTYLVAGTQADKDHLNRLLVLKFFNMNPIKKTTDGNDDDDEDDEDDEEEENLPDLNCISFPHVGCINRVRSKKIGDKYLAANWSDHGAVHLWDITDAFDSCNDSNSNVTEMGNNNNNNNKKNIQTKPIYSFNGHQSPGFGLDWSPTVEGTLATGDCLKHIFIWKLCNQTGWIVDQLPLTGHQDSVEDLQWSPNEPNLLISCSVDRSIRIWDVRNKRQSAITIPDAHQSDVNVISWNRMDKAFILSGGDDGAIKVWDLRQVRRAFGTSGTQSSSNMNGSNNGCIATFKQHQGSITSVDWHPTDGTVFAASGEDHQVTQWDLAVENDDDQEEKEQQQTADNYDHQDHQAVRQLPPQLLFIHQGQKEVKEIHWHPQIPGVLISTASTGFDIFRTVSV